MVPTEQDVEIVFFHDVFILSIWVYMQVGCGLRARLQRACTARAINALSQLPTPARRDGRSWWPRDRRLAARAPLPWPRAKAFTADFVVNNPVPSPV